MINNINDLIKSSEQFSISDDLIDLKEKGRKDFISKFPLSSIQNLELDDYCIGTTDNSFCYWLEFKEILFGIGGGNSSKFGIYKSTDGNYYQGYGPKKIAIEKPELEDQFLALKNEILLSLDYVKKNEIEKIIKIQTPVWNMVLLKIFCIYYPNKFLTIGDPNVIIECAKSIGISNVELKKENSILINFLCRKKLNETKEFSNWNYEKIGAFIYQTFKETAKRDYYLIGSKYGDTPKIDVFTEMLRRSVVATGLASNIDLSEIFNENHSVIKKFLESHNVNGNSINSLKHFLSLKPGDLIGVKADDSPEGFLSIVGIAEIIEKNGKVYEHDPDGLGHIVNVKFTDDTITKNLRIGEYGKAIHKLSNYDHINQIFKLNEEKGYFGELTKFLTQAKTDDLRTTTNNYRKKYLGLDVKIGFGQGGPAKIPWISFLSFDQITSNGIYPVYLYFKAENLLILAYGVSVTHPPKINWKLSNAKTISEYFIENNLGTPFNFGNSFIFKTYKANELPPPETIDADLNEILNYYKSLDFGGPLEPKINKMSLNYTYFHQNSIESGLLYSEEKVIRFISSLLTKPFLILTGLSGSGKTKLAQAFVQWICQDENQYRIIPVGADWTNREPLLGYPNALNTKEYVKPDSGVLDLIIQANNNPELPHFLILDEMNLSHVERYFADFLSVMESKEEIPLYAKGSPINGVPASLKLPSNLFIIGTVNIDETTNMFSPKVLDRANTIEFRVTKEEMKTFLGKITDIKMDVLKGKGAGMAKSFLDMAANKDFTRDEEINNALLGFFEELKKTGAEFGYRSATEILRLINQLTVLDASLTKEQKLDIAIMQKLLPKLHGSRRKLCPVLETLGSFCINGDTKIVKDVFEKTDFDFNSSNVRYPLSLEKISRMYRGAIDNGFASFAEA